MLFIFPDMPGKIVWNWTWGEEVKELRLAVEYREHILPALLVYINTSQPLQC